AVFGLRDGKVRDSFVGALPESAIRAFLDRLLPTPAEVATDEARRLEATDPAAAEATYRRAIELAPNAPDARIGLARLLLAGGRRGGAQDHGVDLPAPGRRRDRRRVPAEARRRTLLSA